METVGQETKPSAGSCAAVESELGSEAPAQPTPLSSNGSGLIARKLRLVIVEDNSSDVELIRHALKKGGFDAGVRVVQTSEGFRSAVGKNGYDIVLADYSLPSWNGLETVAILRQEGLDIPVIVVSGALGDTWAVECIKQGAADYVLKIICRAWRRRQPRVAGKEIAG